jgi:hypothetical protein
LIASRFTATAVFRVSGVATEERAESAAGRNGSFTSAKRNVTKRSDSRLRAYGKHQSTTAERNSEATRRRPGPRRSESRPARGATTTAVAPYTRSVRPARSAESPRSRVT